MKIIASKMSGKSVDDLVVERFNTIKRVIQGDSFEVDKQTLRKYSSIMLTSFIKDVRFVFNASLTVNGPSLSLVSKAFASTADNALDGQLGEFTNRTKDNSDNGLGLASLIEGGPVIGVSGKVQFELYNRYFFPNEVREGLFIKIILDSKLSGFLGYLPHVICKAVETYKAEASHKTSADKIARALLETLSAAPKVLLNNQVFNPTLGAGVEMIFRVSQDRGWEWLNTKYFTTHESKLSLNSTNLVAMTPGTLSVSVSDNKKITDIKQYRLGNGLMSHFTTWRRCVNTKDGMHHSDVKTILKSFYSEDELKDVSKVIVPNKTDVDDRKATLALYQLDTEFFSNDCIAWIIQRYLNAYSAKEGKIVILNSTVGADDLSGQIGRFFGDRASSIFQNAADYLTRNKILP
jgi:hypothetical protein